MQTFLPYPSFRESARVLDNKRLGKQRLEALQLLRLIVSGWTDLNSKPTRWDNHPAAKLWREDNNSLANLALYGIEICLEWRYRGFDDNQLQKFCTYCGYVSGGLKIVPVVFSPALHASHRAALLAKNPEHYKQFGWTEKPEIKYVWR